MVRRILFATLALAPITIAVHYLVHPGGVTDFIFAAVALVPLAWLIGEATEHAANHTGAGIGGFLNATFGNAPELIIALFAVSRRPDRGRPRLADGSVIGNLLLVLGFSLVFGGRGELDRQSAFVSLGLVALAVVLFLVPVVPAYVNDDDPERRLYALLSIGPAVVLLVVYVVTTYKSLRRHRQLHAEEAGEESWSLAVSLVVLGIATVATAIIAEILVGSVETFADKAGLSDFFVAAVIIAIVGNAAEHGGAVVVAHRGKIKLAAEIALASSAQVAVFLIPLVALIAWAIEPLALSFRPVEIAVLAGSTVLTALLIADGRSSGLKGGVLIGAYVLAAAAFFAAGDR